MSDLSEFDASDALGVSTNGPSDDCILMCPMIVSVSDVSNVSIECDQSMSLMIRSDVSDDCGL